MRLDIKIYNTIKKIIMSDVETTWLLATSKCIDIDKIMIKTCPYCSLRLKTKNLLLLHIINQHPDELVKIIECSTSILKSWIRNK